MTEENKKLLWVMGLGAVSLLGCHLDAPLIDEYKKCISPYERETCPSLYPYTKDFKGKEKVLKSRIDEFLKVFTPNPSGYVLRYIIRQLMDREHSDSIQFNADMLEFIALESSGKCYADVKGKEYETYGEHLGSYASEWDRNAFYAFNLANAISLSRIAGYLDMLTFNEVKDLLMEIGRNVEECFSSYHEFGNHVAYVTDIVRHSPHFKKRGSMSSVIPKNQLEYASYGVWAHIPWMGGE